VATTSGRAWAGDASEYYRDVVFSDDGYGPGFMTDLPGASAIDPDPDTDNGFGVNWNFGTSGTHDVKARFIFSDELPTECPQPLPVPPAPPEPDPDPVPTPRFTG